MSRRLVVVADSVLFTLALQALLGGLLGRLYESLGWMTMPLWLALGVWLARVLQHRRANERMTRGQGIAARLVALAGVGYGLFFGDTTPSDGGQFTILLIILAFFALLTAAVALVYDLIATHRRRATQTSPSQPASPIV
jgi:hypothetical protein